MDLLTTDNEFIYFDIGSVILRNVFLTTWWALEGGGVSLFFLRTCFDNYLSRFVELT
jgi:hypothetical protein